MRRAKLRPFRLRPLLLVLFALLLVPKCGFAQTLEYHRFRFFIHPDVVAGLTTEQIKSRLSLYVADVNAIFAKQTIRRFSFNPETDITISATPPTHGYFGGGILPTSGFEVWAEVLPSQHPDYGTHGGRASFDNNGNGVAAGLHWDTVHNPATMSSEAPGSWNLNQYWRQLHNMIHEMEHIFTAGYGEYYSLKSVDDTTGEAPYQAILFDESNPLADPYWAARTDYHTDPLFLWRPYDRTYEQMKEGIRFANVTAAILNGPYRRVSPGSEVLPDLSQTAIQVTYAPGKPLPGAAVKVWNIATISNSDTSTLLYSGVTAADGTVRFAWKPEFNNVNGLILIKAYAPDGSVSEARHFSIFDAQEQKLVYGKNNLLIPIPMGYTPPSTLSVADVTLTEGDSGSQSAKFVVTLSAPSAQMVTVNYATANGSATAGSDYAATGGTLTFSPGEVLKQVSVLVGGDTLDEANETFTLSLSGGVNASIQDAQGNGLILDNDPLSISIVDVTEAEGNGLNHTLVVPVSLNKPSNQVVKVKYATSNGTARSRSDYATASGTLTFNPGETLKYVAILIYSDTAKESNETFYVTLSRPTGAVLADGSSTVTLLTDD